MNTKNKILFLGGDARQEIAAIKLSGRGRRVSSFALSEERQKGVIREASLSDALRDAKALILPLPSSADGVTLNAPSYGGDALRLRELLDAYFSAVGCDAKVIGGRIPIAIYEYALNKGFKVIDYFSSEAFQIKNAYTTAEGALFVAMENLKKNVRGASFTVTGYGRIARSLVRLLIGLGGSVCVLARKESDLAFATLDGASASQISKSSLKIACRESDVIFNTVPAWLFDGEVLEEMSEETLIIDLASSPGGVDLGAAKRLSSRVLWASSLPGKYAPESAGELIAECVSEILDREGI